MTTPDLRPCPRCGAPLADAEPCPSCERAQQSGAPRSSPWMHALKRPVPGPFCIPALAGETLALPTADGNVIGLARADGAVRWEYAPTHGARAALAGDGARIFVTTADRHPSQLGDTLLALDPGSGGILWSFAPSSPGALSAPMYADNTVFVGCALKDRSLAARRASAGRDRLAGRAYALDAATGKERWSSKLSGWASNAPAVGVGVVLFVGDNGHSLHAFDRASGGRLWEFQARGRLDAPAVTADLVVVRSTEGTLYALKLATGTLSWQLRGERGQGFSSPPVLAGDQLLVGDRVGKTGSDFALRALRVEDGAELWRFGVDTAVMLPPLVVGELVLCLSEGGRGFALDRADGALRWQCSTGAAPVARLVDAEGLFYLVDKAGTLYAYDFADALAARHTPGAQVAAKQLPRGAELELDLWFEAGQGAVTVRWQSVASGVTRSRLVPSYGDDRTLVLRALEQQQTGAANLAPAELARLVAHGLSPDGLSLDPDAPRVVGRALLQALAADQAAAEALTAVRSLAINQHHAIDLRLHFAPEDRALSTLPWELLWDLDETPLLLGGPQVGSCTRCLDLPFAVPKRHEPGAELRILVVAPRAGADDEATWQREREVRNTALGLLAARSAVAVHELLPATRNSFIEAAQEELPYDVILFVGRGGYQDDKGHLVLDSDGGGWDPMPVGQIVPLFRKARLALLIACESATVGEAGLLTGIAPALCAAGVAAVVAMQLSVRRTAASRFVELFCRRMAAGDTLRAAMMQTRQALFVEEAEGRSWFVPTLTVRDPAAAAWQLVRKDRP